MTGGENDLAPSSDETTVNVIDEVVLRVTVRRDFPLRDGEKNGDWQWSDTDGNPLMQPMNWTKPEDATLEPDVELEASTPRAIYGWNIGQPRLGSEGDNGGEYTTDRIEPISSSILLLRITERTEGETVEFEREILLEAQTIRSDSGQIDKDGEVLLPTGGLTGTFVLRIEPDELYDGEVGPDLMEVDDPPDILYQSVDISVELEEGYLVEVQDPYNPPEGATDGRIGNRQKFEPTTSHLPVSLKPIWWNHIGGYNRPAGNLDLFVIHRTNGSRLGNAINRFFAGDNIGAHYIMETDGHIIKLCRERKEVRHAGVGRWAGRAWSQRNRHDSFSIGIEIINPNQENLTNYPNYSTRANPPYTPEQYVALCSLTHQLVQAHPHIGVRVVGHCDVATGPPRAGTPNDCYSTKRSMDPGTHFEWERLESDGLGMIAGEDHFQIETSYGGAFHNFSGLTLRKNDRDPHGTNPAILGGSPRAGFTGQTIREIQQDLVKTGYSLRVNGRFDDCMGGAVDRFKRHFFSASRGALTGESLNQAIAERIRNVAEEVDTSIWECWIQTVTRMTNAKYHSQEGFHGPWERGLIGVYRTREDALRETDTDDNSVWEKLDGTFECWLVRTTQSLSFKFHSAESHQEGERGLICVYSLEDHANRDLGFRSGHSQVWRKRRS